MNGVFDTRAGTIYDDDIKSRYHFPDRYLEAARGCRGDWIVYREPRRNKGRSGYIGVARVVSVEPDTAKDGYSYARLAEYLDLDQVVPLVGPAGAYEAALRAIPEARKWGASLQGRSVRTIASEDFAAIARAGFTETLAPWNARRLELDPGYLSTLRRESLSTLPPRSRNAASGRSWSTARSATPRSAAR